MHQPEDFGLVYLIDMGIIISALNHVDEYNCKS